MTEQSDAVDGLLVVDKPRAWTSHDVVARVRRISGQKRTGHAGTLDPLATGVLPLGLGQGTRVLSYLSESGKTYLATIRLGVSTNTYDSDGEITREAAALDIPRSSIERVLEAFRGTFEQRPPRFSALKRQGRPLYAYARAGIDIDIPTRLVHVHDLRLLSYEPPDLEVEIDCASGFYVRSLANDLGELLGCGAHLRDLVRTRVGPFKLEDAVSLDELAATVDQDGIGRTLWSLDAPLLGWPVVILGEAHATDLVQGKALQLSTSASGKSEEYCRAYSATGELIALLRIDAQRGARPFKVFPPGHRGPNIEQVSTPFQVTS